jgi:hypothetical protein
VDAPEETWSVMYLARSTKLAPASTSLYNFCSGTHTPNGKTKWVQKTPTAKSERFKNRERGEYPSFVLGFPTEYIIPQFFAAALEERWKGERSSGQKDSEAGLRDVKAGVRVRMEGNVGAERRREGGHSSSTGGGCWSGEAMFD